jgi:adenine deaminase
LSLARTPGDVNALKERILAARRQIPADLVLKGGKVVNVFSGEIQERDVAVYGASIAGVGSGYQGKEEVNVTGKWIVPGLIDGHIHIESSMLLPSNLAAALLAHGTTSIVSDPHEIANVMGIDGIQFMLSESGSIPFDVFFMAPSCVPATTLETAGAALSASDLKGLKNEPRVLGLAGVMNFPGVLMGDEGILEKIALFADRVIDGHCPSVRGHDLQAYLTAGIRSDHESVEREEGLEKVEGGVMLMIREGTSAKNLEQLLPLVNSKNARRFCFVTDDLHAEDIQERGHLNFVVKKAIQLGLDPVTAVQLVTLNPAEYFGLKDRGAIAPGYLADVVVLDELEGFEVAYVYKNGQLVVDRGTLLNFTQRKDSALPGGYARALNIAPLSPDSFRIPHSGGKARVIEVIPSQIITRVSYEQVESIDGWVSSDVKADILKLSVVERHRASGRIGLGLVKGFGLKRGAIASSVAHDSHNVIVVGVSDEEIFRAVEVVRDMGGGLAVVRANETLAKIPLEIAGLMSSQPLKILATQMRALKDAAYGIGCILKEPFMSLSFLALPVIPELKLTDRGLVDVKRFMIVPLFIDNR